jgi:uncharacterized sporulation protein YeaH/YhbH (DUF444 family)
MGLREDLKRFQKIGAEERQDLQEFIQHGDISQDDNIQVPIKIVDLPEFEYDQYSMGGIGQGEGDQGDPVPVDEQQGEPQEDGDDGEPGEDGAEHGHYEMDPEEFAEELDKELDLDLDPKGKQIKNITEGALVEKARTGPESTVDFENLYKKGLKREMALYFDEDYVREVMKVRGMGVESVYKWARENNIPVSKGWIENEYENIKFTVKYDSVDDIEQEYSRVPQAGDIDEVTLRRDDKRHKHPEINKEYERNAVIVFIRDVSGSMHEDKREIVERVFTPLDWYLTGKYDEAKFHYIAHDFDAWETSRDEFFGIKSGGGTKISSAYELCQEILEENYPFSEWNRYVFAAGDGENTARDSTDNVVELMKNIEANLHAYLEVEGKRRFGSAHGEIIEKHLGGRDNVVVTQISDKSEVMDSIEEILSTEDNND